MKLLLFATASLYLLPLCGSAGIAEEPAGQKGRAILANMSADNFIRRFDKNKDGVLTKDELPPHLAERFDKLDTNGDGKLDREEVEAFLKRLRERMATAKPGKPGMESANAARTVDLILKRFDTNHDGKISKDEAKGPLLKNFDRIDANRDGYLDRKELLRIAPVLQKFMVNRVGAEQAVNKGKTNAPARPPAKPSGPDFDSLDSDADGRLSPNELKGTPLADAFDKIDANKDGKIDRKEFEAYLQREAIKKAEADKK
jgi:Ca2+-binding EF-hand superfamily protein